VDNVAVQNTFIGSLALADLHKKKIKVVALTVRLTGHAVTAFDTAGCLTGAQSVREAFIYPTAIRFK